MTYERTSVVLTDEELEAMKTGLAELESKVSKYAVNLKIPERRSIYKLGPHALPFVELAVKFSKENPQFGTAYIDLAKLEQDFTFYLQIKGLVESSAPLLEKLTDSYMAVGADAFTVARAYYDAVKAAAKANKPGANALVAELRKVFYRKKSITKPAETPEALSSTPVAN